MVRRILASGSRDVPYTTESPNAGVPLVRRVQHNNFNHLFSYSLKLIKWNKCMNVRLLHFSHSLFLYRYLKHGGDLSTTFPCTHEYHSIRVLVLSLADIHACNLYAEWDAGSSQFSIIGVGEGTVVAVGGRQSIPGELEGVGADPSSGSSSPTKPSTPLGPWRGRTRAEV